MSDYDDFDADDDSDDEELEVEGPEEKTTVLTSTLEFNDSGNTEVWVTLETGDLYVFDVVAWNWQEQPLVQGVGGKPVSVAQAAAETEYRLRHQVPLSKARHRQISRRLTATLAWLDGLIPELNDAYGGHAAKDCIVPTMDALIDLELALSQLHFGDYARFGVGHPYEFKYGVPYPPPDDET